MYGSLQISVNYIVIFIDHKKNIVIFDFEPHALKFIPQFKFWLGLEDFSIKNYPNLQENGVHHVRATPIFPQTCPWIQIWEEILLNLAPTFLYLLLIVEESLNISSNMKRRIGVPNHQRSQNRGIKIQFFLTVISIQWL